jgi:APA family basic amino acid/polyamine antiporter
MLPTAGGFYVYARRAFGGGVGFAVGWSDWIANTAAIAYVALATGEYLGRLIPALSGYGQLLTLGALALITALHWLGVRIGSGVQGAMTALVGVMLVGLAICCLTVTLPAPPPESHAALEGSVLPGHGHCHRRGHALDRRRL